MTNFVIFQPNSPTILQTCLVLVRCDDEILLGEKLRGFGQGRVVAPGGKIDPGESPSQAASRELYEETSLQVAPEHLHYAGLVTFTFNADPDGGMCAHIFTTSDVTGTPQHSDEIAVSWTPVAAIPYERMWPDAAHWLPRVLAGDVINIEFIYSPDSRTLRCCRDFSASE